MSEPAIESTPAQKPNTSSWFNSFTLSPNLTNQLSNLSTSIREATTKVGNAATTLVQKSLPQRPSTPDENETPPKDFTSMLSDLGSSVLKSAQQLKQVVEEKSILGNFTKEQDKFLTEKRTQQKREEDAMLPWVGYKGEDEIKKQILALSQEKRNFLRSPPPGANYHFDMATAYPIALVILDVDENLNQMRFDLVPKQITEEAFWKNYFYRVSLIKQSVQLTALANENTNTQSTDELHTSPNNRSRLSSDLQDKIPDINQEFVSEDYDTSAVNLDDIRREIEQLSMGKRNKSGSPELDETEWDKALTDELENVSAEELEAQINQMLSSDTK